MDQKSQTISRTLKIQQDLELPLIVQQLGELGV
jgi:hypothetical protein